MAALLHPHLVNAPFGDPGLYVDFCEARRGLLFDLGNIESLWPRQLLRLSHVFVTHTHMDHFCGFDHLLRVVLGRKAGVVIFGGPGFVSQVDHKLSAYNWNVAHQYDQELVIDAREMTPDGRRGRALFSSRRRFVREDCPPPPGNGDVIHEEASFRVRGRFVDHDIPCLAYLIEEKARVAVVPARLAARGFARGAWLRELKEAVLAGAPDGAPIRVEWRDRHGDHATPSTVGELRPLVLDTLPGRRFGYVTDLRYTEANVSVLAELMAGVDTLFIESVFLDADGEHGVRKNHLTARQAGEIARRVGARAVVPFHFSPRYEGCGAALAAEVQGAWTGQG